MLAATTRTGLVVPETKEIASGAKPGVRAVLGGMTERGNDNQEKLTSGAEAPMYIQRLAATSELVPFPSR